MANALKTNPDDLYNPDSTENYRAQARKRAIQDEDIARGIDEAEKYAMIRIIARVAMAAQQTN